MLTEQTKKDISSTVEQLMLVWRAEYSLQKIVRILNYYTAQHQEGFVRNQQDEDLIASLRPYQQDLDQKEYLSQIIEKMTVIVTNEIDSHSLQALLARREREIKEEKANKQENTLLVEFKRQAELYKSAFEDTAYYNKEYHNVDNPYQVLSGNWCDDFYPQHEKMDAAWEAIVDLSNEGLAEAAAWLSNSKNRPSNQ